MGKKCDLSDFDRGMIVGSRQGGLSISETDDLPEFSCATFSRVAENGAKNKKKTSSEQQFCRQKRVRGEGPDWPKLIGRSQ